MLVREPPLDPAAVQAAASEAAWQLPRTIAVLAIAGEQGGPAALRLPTDAIAETIGELTCAIIPDPEGPGRQADLERAMLDGGAQAGLGTTVDWPDAAVSFARARAALELADGDTAALIVARERAGELLLHSDARLAREFASDRLAPLARLPAGSRTRLTETLEAWLAEQGRLTSVAERLGVHPQTARYRLARLRELFGGSLDDPEQRFWLEVALRVR
jgi:hypothetical protein